VPSARSRGDSSARQLAGIWWLPLPALSTNCPIKSAPTERVNSANWRLAMTERAPLSRADNVLSCRAWCDTGAQASSRNFGMTLPELSYEPVLLSVRGRQTASSTTYQPTDPVGEFTDQVGTPVVAGILLDHVDVDRSQGAGFTHPGEAGVVKAENGGLDPSAAFWIALSGCRWPAAPECLPFGTREGPGLRRDPL
jgi:hypothetical protein